ncbi:MAG: WbqC family protein [Candidatus Latescibacterota bacterium]
MIAAIHQPQFMPWLGYFDKMDRADAFVLLDTVQFKKNEFQNRNRIKTAQGPMWLTVPVTYRFPQRIGEVGVDRSGDWRRRHLQALRTNYARAAWWEESAASLEEVYGPDWESLAPLNAASIAYLRSRLGIATPLHWASRLGVHSEEPTARLVEICRLLGADTYLAGAGGRDYMDLEAFARAGVTVLVQEYEHPVYPQCFGAFTSHLSALDLVLNCGPDSLDILRRGRAGARAGGGRP